MRPVFDLSLPFGLSPASAEVYMLLPKQVSYELGQTVEFTLQAYDTDQCSEVSISDVGLAFNMDLSAPTRMESLGVDDAPKSVQRTFTWPAYFFDETGTMVETTNAGLDQRDQFSVVCFYTSDSYLLTVLPFHCVEITLVQVRHWKTFSKRR
eukprot:4798226-Pyramimonas_sp.AAC.1